jgi:MFS family permease
MMFDLASSSQHTASSKPPLPSLRPPSVQVGPILGPLVGGGLSDAFGWRSTFVALAIFAAVALVGKLWVIREVSSVGV